MVNLYMFSLLYFNNICRFLALGAKCYVDREDVDQEDWSKIDSWIESCVSHLGNLNLEIRDDYLELPEPGSLEGGVSRTSPFMASLRVHA